MSMCQVIMSRLRYAFKFWVLIFPNSFTNIITMEKFITLKQAYQRPIEWSNFLQFIISFSKCKCEKHPLWHVKPELIFRTSAVSANWEKVNKKREMMNLAQRPILKNLKCKGFSNLSYNGKQMHKTTHRTYRVSDCSMLSICVQNLRIGELLRNLWCCVLTGLDSREILSYAINSRFEYLGFILNLCLDEVYTSNICTCKREKTSFSHFIQVF